MSHHYCKVQCKRNPDFFSFYTYICYTPVIWFSEGFYAMLNSVHCTGWSASSKDMQIQQISDPCYGCAHLYRKLPEATTAILETIWKGGDHRNHYHRNQPYSWLQDRVLTCILLFSPKLLGEYSPSTEAESKEDSDDSQKMTAVKKRLSRWTEKEKEKM